jgi:hypothetical protein
MLPNSHLAIVTRNEAWQGDVATEPYECGWAREAVFFLRALKPPAIPSGTLLHVEISPDGMHWAPHGATIAVPTGEGAMTAVHVERFGGWLRLAGTLPAGAQITVLASLHLKA